MLNQIKAFSPFFLFLLNPLNNRFSSFPQNNSFLHKEIGVFVSSANKFNNFFMCSAPQIIMARCELCKARARIFCDSDQARLCWNCDARVHSANFLVARHLRKLLCHICRSPTPWSAAGAKLSPTLAVCDRCVVVVNGRRAGESGVEQQEAAVEVVGENHVVPWSPPPAAESSSDEDSGAISKKRCGVKTARASSDLLSDENLSCTSKKSEKRSPSNLDRLQRFL